MLVKNKYAPKHCIINKCRGKDHGQKSQKYYTIEEEKYEVSRNGFSLVPCITCHPRK